MELLASNFQPLKCQHNEFSKKFAELLSESSSVDIAVGYVSERSLEYLADCIYKKSVKECNLIIGMHYFDKFTYSQYAAAKEVETFLLKNNLGTVKLVTSFPFHGKIYSFRKKSGELVSIIGSSNLSNVPLHKPVRQYEFDLLIDNERINEDINVFINKLSEISCDLSSPGLELTDFKQTNNLLEGLAGVKRIEDKKVIANIKNKMIQDKMIHIPLKTREEAPKSNINAYFGKGRESENKIIRSRPWYEVELIVPKNITDLLWYPKAGREKKENIITVITDDGYEFKCKISGDNSKNFRSDGDLKVLGKWLKGRLENAGVLKVGEPVTTETLIQYGCNKISLCPTEDGNIWFLDFNSEKRL